MKTKKVRPVLVESKESTLHLSHGKLLITSIESTGKSDLYKSIPQELILISLEDEEIEENDYYYFSKSNSLHKHLGTLPLNKYKHDGDKCFKVIARQSQIPQEYISKFIEQYNQGCVEDLEIEMEEDGYIINKSFPASVKQRLVVKLKNRFVTIVEKDSCKKCKNTCKKTSTTTNEFGSCTEFNKESITYTEEECLKYCLKALEIGFDLNNTPLPRLNEKSGKQYFVDWFEQNKKK